MSSELAVPSELAALDRRDALRFAFFASIIDRLDVPARQIVFVDDSARNVAAATSCGIRAHLHDPSSGAAGMRRMLEGAGVRM